MVSISLLAVLFAVFSTGYAEEDNADLEKYLNSEIKSRIPSFSFCGDTLNLEDYCTFEILNRVCDMNSDCVAFVKDEIVYSSEKTVQELDNVVAEAVKNYNNYLEV
ncbi:hypothetical protein L596_009397 [Steinernema carpocapsae]|nr:hypothetical protein L596_009397 [Steinernema carpocapsae]